MEWRNSFLNYLLLAGLLLSFFGLAYALNPESRNVILLFSSIAFILALLISLFIYNRNALPLEEKYEVKFNHKKILCTHPQKPDESILWKEIFEIVVVTTDKGPHEPYIWILLSNASGNGCMFPLGSKNSRMAIEKILGFNEFDLRLWSEAMKSTENNRFVVWRKSKTMV